MTPLNLSPSEKETFAQDGVVCLRGVLTYEEIDALRYAVGLQMQNVGSSPGAYDFEAISDTLWSTGQNPFVGGANRLEVEPLAQAILTDPDARPLLEEVDSGAQGGFFYDSAGWHHYEGIRRVAFDSTLPEIVSTLLESKTLRFWEDTTFVKAPHTKQKTAFHQDVGFTQAEGDQCAIVWIPLDNATLENGVMRYVRGSHRWGERYAANTLITQTPLPGSEAEKCPDIEATEDDYDIVSFDVAPGDVIIHHILTIHGAGGNPSDQMRRAISFRYCGDDVRYFNRPGALPQQGVSHSLKDGDPLYSSDYPMVWPKPWPTIRLSEQYARDRRKGRI